MMHLTADIPVTLINRSALSLGMLSSRPSLPDTSASWGTRSGWRPSFQEPPTDVIPIWANAVFFSDLRNFLENRHADFHYSAIGRIVADLMVSGCSGSRLLNDDDAASHPSVGFSVTRVEQASSAAHKRVMAGVSTQLGRLHFRTGERKINQHDCDSAEDKQVDSSFANAVIMRIEENIQAKYPPYATIDPILHESVRELPTDRGTIS